LGKASRAKRERRSAPALLYHFTSTLHLPLIKRDGFLRPTESNVSLRIPHVGPDVVWLLDTPTADAPHGLNNALVDKRAVRITVRTKAERWLDWIARQPTMDVFSKQVLIETGGGMEAAAHWYVTEQRIPRSEWVAVEVAE
jgi:hypothetical protein